VPKEFVISVDLGGTKILSALLSINGKIIDRVKVPTVVEEGCEPIVNSILESISKIISKDNLHKNEIKAISIGVPGTVNPNTGLISDAPNLKVQNFNIKEAIQKHHSIPVLIENDVNLAALGINGFEFNNKIKNALIIFVGTGIGGALIFDGNIYRGSSFFAGEIGHMLVQNDGSFSSSKGKSTFELLASRTAIVKNIKKDLKKGKESLIKQIVGNNKAIKSKALAAAVKKGDRLVVKHVTKSCNIIGTVLGSLTFLLNIDTIILGGGVIEAMNSFMIPKIKESFNEAVLEEPGYQVKIVATRLGDDAPLYGGIALAEEFLK
jgi:glucokinase